MSKALPGLSDSSRNPWIDALRGIAALAVMIIHFNCVMPDARFDLAARVWLDIGSYGHLGVPVFFTISGYCIFSSWWRSTNPLEFVTRRLYRIYPAYLASLVAVMFIVLATKWLTGVNDVTPLPNAPFEIVATLALITAPVSGVQTVNWVYWTLSYELAFYLIAGSVLLTTKSSARLVSLAVLHLLLCGLVAASVSWPAGPGFFVHLWPLFGAGMSIAVHRHSPIVAKVMLVGVVVAAIPAFMSGGGLGYLASLLTLTLIYVSRRIAFPRSLDWLKTCGEFSYSIYLVHIPLGLFGAHRLLWILFPPASGIGLIALQMAAVLITLAIARLFFLLAEKPFLRSRPSS